MYDIPFSSTPGGMSELAFNLSNNFCDDGNFVFRVNTSLKKKTIFHYFNLLIHILKCIYKKYCSNYIL